MKILYLSQYGTGLKEQTDKAHKALDNVPDFEPIIEPKNVKGTKPEKEKVKALIANNRVDHLAIFQIKDWTNSLEDFFTFLRYLKRKRVYLTITSAELTISPHGAQEQAIKLLASCYKLLEQKHKEKISNGQKKSKSKAGRPKGAKDKKKRKTDGYKKREAKKRLPIPAKEGKSEKTDKVN